MNKMGETLLQVITTIILAKLYKQNARNVVVSNCNSNINQLYYINNLSIDHIRILAKYLCR